MFAWVPARSDVWAAWSVMHSPGRTRLTRFETKIRTRTKRPKVHVDSNEFLARSAKNQKGDVARPGLGLRRLRFLILYQKVG
jgi:hypothetical protein